MNKKKVDFSHICDSSGSLPEDRMHTFLLNKGTIRGAILMSTRMVNEMKNNHELGIIETLVLGHAYTACGLLTSDMKGNEKVILNIDCTGPLSGFSVEATAQGDIRGFLKCRKLEIVEPMENFDLSSFYGTGFLFVTKYLEKTAQPFTGQVVLKYGTLAEDLAYYFLTSEQIPSAFHLSVKFNKQGKVTGAGGLALHAMPGADEETVGMLADKLDHFPSLGELFEKLTLPEAILSTYFPEFGPCILGTRPIRFFCSCSKKRFRGYIAAMPQEDLKDILENGPLPVVVTCHNCSSSYSYEKEEIIAMIR